MSKNFQELHDDHYDFEKGRLDEHVGDNPLEIFAIWYNEAIENKVLSANTMSVNTVSSSGQPSSRMVYLKDVEDGNFRFFTNYNSQKGKDIEGNNRVGLLFYWSELERQVRISGLATKSTKAISEAYFKRRPLNSQIGAWASNQSEELKSREDLENKADELSKKFGSNVPLPPHWGGYDVEALQIEFWQGRKSRLHDRILFEKVNGAWTKKRLNP
ncbi:MAG: pyridoxamine 5'-phosphate oxidase [Lentimonas sp.]|jgi:pyridoxamine 5'-phosphate oxidase